MTSASRRRVFSLFILMSSAPALSAESPLALPERMPQTWEASPGRTAPWDSEIAELHARLDTVQRQYGAYADAGKATGHGKSKLGWTDGPRPRWVVSAEYLNWQLRRSDLDYAIPSDGSALAVGAGNLERPEFERDSGVRTWLGYRTGSCWESGVGYTYFSTSATATAMEPAVGSLWATRSYPDGNEQAATATAFGSFDYHVVDLESRYAFSVSESASLKMFGGPRWAKIDQDVRFAYDGRDFDNGLVRQPVSMNAFGARVGIDGYWHVWRRCSFFGRGALSIMYGEFQTRLVETNVSGAATIVDVTDNYTQVVPVLDAAVGMSWRWRDRLEIATGYELTSWFNAGTRSSFVDSVQQGLYNHEPTDLLLDGVFFRFTVWL